MTNEPCGEAEGKLYKTLPEKYVKKFWKNNKAEGIKPSASCLVREAGLRQKNREESLCTSEACSQPRSRFFCLLPTQSMQTVWGPY